MDKPTKTDKEIIEFILNIAFDNNGYPYIDVESIAHILIVENKENVNKVDVARLFKKLELNSLLATAYPVPGGHDYKIFRLSHKGMEIMREHKSYSMYLEYLKKEEKRKNRAQSIERNIKNWNIIVTLIITSIGFVFTQCPSIKRVELLQVQQEIRLNKSQLDSLKLFLDSIRKMQKQPVSKDTAK